jgi:hypothetical protein
VFEVESDVLLLLLDEFLLLLLGVELLLPVVGEGQIIDVLHELLLDVAQALKPTSQQEEGLDVVLATLRHRLPQRIYLLINTALIIQRQKYE